MKSSLFKAQCDGMNEMRAPRINSRLGQLSSGQPGRPSRLALTIIVVAFVALVATAITILAVNSSNCRQDADCFIARAQQCKAATLRSDIANGTIVKYVEKDCTLTKSIDTFGPAEPQQVVDYFKGKNMTCVYVKGNFNPVLIDGLTIDGCTGTLREAIVTLQTVRAINEASK